MLNTNKSLLNLLNRVLGENGKYTSNGNYSYHCPICNHHKRKLEINLETNEKGENPWHCWTCLETKGKTIKSLFSKLKVHENKIDELKLILRPNINKTIKEEEKIELPSEFISLNDIKNFNKVTQLEARKAIQYLKKRHITKDDILKYNIGFCEYGKYAGRIIIPSYNNKGEINYFAARSFKDDVFPKYKNPPISSKIIGFELFINWDAPIMLVEGIFDALTIKRNVIPLFGKIINNSIMEKILQSSVENIYICLDPDAIRSSIKYAEQLLNLGKKVYLVEIDGKDINEIGYNRFLSILEKTQPLTFSKLLSLKLNLI